MVPSAVRINIPLPTGALELSVSPMFVSGIPMFGIKKSLEALLL